ncbi:MAG: DEAD/DEAH box helicase family protein [Desulfobia sp.]
MSRLSLSEHTLDVNIRRCDIDRFDFSEVEDYVAQLTGERQYQFNAVKEIMIYLWGGAYESVTDLARESYGNKEAIRKRFLSEDHFLHMLPLPGKLSGVCHLATGTGKSYVMFAVAHLSLLLGKVKRVLVLGPSSTVIEQGLRDKFKEYLYGEKGAELKEQLPENLRHKAIRMLNCNDPVEDGSIVIENINAIYNRERNSIGDTLFNHGGEVLVLSDEVHHAYSHLNFSGDALQYAFGAGEEWRGELRDERLWMKFIREENAIRRHIGFTGTPYNKNDYFPDVLCNYSIKDAIDEKNIKRINAILKTETDEGDRELTTRQRYEQILATHAGNRRKYAYPDTNGKPAVKPITVFIHPTQAAARRNTDEFVKILAETMPHEDATLAGQPRSVLEQQARERVICVISKPGETDYKEKLDQIEETDPEKTGGRVEFIFAVNKLSEGWDVDNVFQIVPSEERVFNSKLLISQVLGRGLRLPRNVRLGDINNKYPMVTITNHDRFAKHIRELLDEVTECEMRFTSNVLQDQEQKRYRHHFCLFNLKYLPSQRTEDRPPDELTEEPRTRELILTPSADKLGVKVIYMEGTRHFELTKDFFTVDQVVLEIENRFKNRGFERRHFDFGDGIVCDDLPGPDNIEEVIRAAMDRAGIEGDLLSAENRRQVELFFNQFLPKGRKKVIRERIEGEVQGISTTEMQQMSARSGGVDQTVSVFISEDYKHELSDQNLFIIDEIGKQPQQQNLPNFTHEYIRKVFPAKHLYAVNTSLLRTPQDLVILSHEPEREFLFRLIEHAKYINAWVKSPDTSFYSLDYEYWKRGKDRVRRSFNPDFFISLSISDYLLLNKSSQKSAADRLRYLQDKGVESITLVVEIKDDDDNSEATAAKEQFGKEHFKNLNSRLGSINPFDMPEEFQDHVGQRYIFQILRPGEFAGWFSRLANGLFIQNLELQTDSEG